MQSEKQREKQRAGIVKNEMLMSAIVYGLGNARKAGLDKPYDIALCVSGSIKSMFRCSFIPHSMDRALPAGEKRDISMGRAEAHLKASLDRYREVSNT